MAGVRVAGVIGAPLNFNLAFGTTVISNVKTNQFIDLLLVAYNMLTR